jgi:WD domain, G-beta repeat
MRKLNGKSIDRNLEVNREEKEMNSTRAIALFLLIVSGLIGYAAPSSTRRSDSAASAAPPSQSAIQIGRVRSVVFSADGKMIAAIGDLEDKTTLWDTTTGEQLRAPEGLTDGVYCIAFSPDSSLIATGLAIYGRRPRLWEAASGRLLHSFAELRDTTYSVYSVAFSPGGKTIASGSERAIGIWDVTTGKQLTALEGHSGKIHLLAFSPDGKIIASGSEDQTVKLWDTATGKQLRSLNGWVNSLAFSPDGKVLISARGNTIKFWNVATGNQVRSLEAETGVSVALSPDGKVIAGAGSDGTVRLWNVATGEKLRSMTGHAGEVNTVAFSPNGKIIASGSDDHTIRFWDTATGAQIRALGSPVPSQDSTAQAEEEIPEKNWRRHPKIIPILNLVNSINVGLKKRSFKTAQRKFNCEEVPYFTLLRIARNARGAVTWYENYQEGEDSSWDEYYYYDAARRLRFVLMTSYAANGTREQHRIYFDENGKLLRTSRKLLKGPGYFGPQHVEELVNLDPAKDFEAQPPKDASCKEIKPQPKPRVKKR